MAEPDNTRSARDVPRDDRQRRTLTERFPALGQLRLKRRNRIPYVQQTTAVDCGAACLAMVLGYHGKHVGLTEVREAAGASLRGTSAASLLEAGRYFGLQGRGVQMHELDDLQYLESGAILHWKLSHYVVLERLVNKGAWIVNPDGGRQFVTTEELDKSFSGIALTFQPGEDFEEQEAQLKGIWRYLQRVFDEAGLIARVVVTSAFVHVLALAIPLLTSILVDRIVPRGDQRLLGVLAIGIVGVIAFNFLASLVRSFLLIHLRTRLDARLALEFLDHMVDLPYLFFQQRSSGDLMMRLTSNSTIREFLTSGALSAVLDGTMVTFYLVVLLIANFKIGLLVAFLGLLRVSIFLLARTRVRELMSQALQAQAKARGYEFEILTGIGPLKAAGAELKSVQTWSKLFVKELNVSLDRGRLDATVNAMLQALGVASPLLILLYGSLLVIEGELSLGTMLALNALAQGFLTPLSTLVSTAFNLQLMGSYLNRVNDVLEAPRERVGSAGQQVAELSGRITLEDVTFRYSPTGPPALQRVSFEIPPGGFVGIVGQSGSGKSTLAALLAGLYMPDTGKITYDGSDLAELDLRSLRRKLGLVPQQPYLFGSSIRSNIALVEPDMPMSLVFDAAQKACIHEDVMAMPMRYETVLAENGASISGGQRQRIALAQALVRKPNVLILDEATSALDAMIEQKVYAHLKTLKCTRVVIAHRLSTIRHADLILVLEGGRIVERGNHSQLLKLGGTYQKLVEAQLDTGEEADSPS